jgi:peptidyl-tRNA hydrolase
MSLRLLTGKGNSNAKFAITPHQHSQVMVEQIRKRKNWKLEGTHKAIYE